VPIPPCEARLFASDERPWRIDVREKIADLAGVCSRTVGNVKVILKKVHPSVIEALHNGTITINAAMEVCKFDRILISLFEHSASIPSQQIRNGMEQRTFLVITG
jgi:hypothetical protein